MNPFKELYRSERLPVFQNRMYDSPEEAVRCPTGDVVLVQDLNSGLIHNSAFEPDLLVYDSNYQNEQSHSGAFQAHLLEVEGIIRRNFPGYSLIEVGCGKGGFLEQLQLLGYDIIGMDPAYEGANPAIFKKAFTGGSDAHADGIILRHVLEHIQDPVSFLRKIAGANRNQGKIYIEVPCFDWICSNRTWFDVFYEHVNYFRLDDFHRMFGVVHEAARTFNGQYLSIVADLASLRDPEFREPFDFPANFDSGIAEISDAIRADSGKCIHTAVWGGASKGVIFSIHMSRLGADIAAIVDINPAKQDKFIAVTGQRVLSPEEAMNRLGPDASILVMNANYLDEVKSITDNRYRYSTI